jgi:predicted transcriptional regulator
MPKSATPKFHQPEPCHVCGGPRQRVNGDWLREQRHRAGLTLADIAKQLNRSVVVIHIFEKEKRNCPAYVLAAYEALTAREG